MEKKRKRQQRAAPTRSRAADRRESGEPGGGQGRRDEVGASGVYSPSADNIPPDAEVRMAGSWGGGDYNESGGSELVYRDGVVLGGTTAGPDGEPTLDIHAGDPPAPDARSDAPRSRDEGAATTQAPIDSVEMRLRGLPKGSGDEPAPRKTSRSKRTRTQRRKS